MQANDLSSFTLCRTAKAGKSTGKLQIGNGNTIGDRATIKPQDSKFKATIKNMARFLTNWQTGQKISKAQPKQKKMNFFGRHRSGTIAFVPNEQDNPLSKAKNPIPEHLIFIFVFLFTRLSK